MSLVEIHAAIILGTLIVYAVTGGADFGGGVWDLFARGPRSAAQREVIEHAISPVWEANHVWLIMAIVLSFTAFPLAFAEVMTVLTIPMVVLLLGIVFRGSAFVLRQYGGGSESSRHRWGRVFAVASLITPVFLGIVAGAITDGGVVPGAYLDAWIAPLPWLVGAFTLALFAATAAVYLTTETTEPALRRDFRFRATIAQIIAGILGWTITLLAPGAFAEHLVSSWWHWALQLATAACAITVLVLLWRDRYRLARALVIVQVALVLVGWGAALLPYAVPPRLTLNAAAAPPSTLRVLLVVIIAGAIIIVPVYFYLLRVFKRTPSDQPRQAPAA